MKLDNIKSKKWIVISLVIILIVTLTPGNGKIAGAQLDKVVHFLIFFLLAISISHVYIKDRKLTHFLLYAMLLGFATEILQQFIPGRNLEFNDALADCLGVLFGYVVYLKYNNRINRLLD